MNLLIIVLLAGFLMPGVNAYKNKSSIETRIPEEKFKGTELNFQEESGQTRMRSIIFKAQEYCRAELKDFEFDVQFKVLSATVYFYDKNFRGTEVGYLKGSSLKPIESLMKRCVPGTFVVFDDIMVLGPDNIKRKIDGQTVLLY